MLRLARADLNLADGAALGAGRGEGGGHTHEGGNSYIDPNLSINIGYKHPGEVACVSGWGGEGKGELDGVDDGWVGGFGGGGALPRQYHLL